jgi:hypothetical protein
MLSLCRQPKEENQEKRIVREDTAKQLHAQPEAAEVQRGSQENKIFADNLKARVKGQTVSTFMPLR